ncbi:hypothetical protein A6V25_32600 [Nostoc sp. ATCC 53789]|nr:hypothetical protein A6V25_32600 [Nostoc sp. ATCC 53789]
MPIYSELQSNAPQIKVILGFVLGFIFVAGLIKNCCNHIFEAEVEKRTAELRAAQAKLLEQSRQKLGLSLSRFTFQFQWGSFTRPDSERFK